METLPQSGVDALPGLGAAFGTMFFFGLLFYVYFCGTLFVIARKQGIDNAWLAWVPVVNILLMCRIAGRPGWWFVLMLIPLVNLIVLVVLWMDIAKACGKESWVGLLIIVPVIGLAVPAYLALAGVQRTAPSTARPTADATPQKPAARPTSCPACGAGLAAGDDFCGSCGQAVPKAAPGAPSVAAAPGSKMPLLVAGAAAAVLVMFLVGFFGIKMLMGGSGRQSSVSDPVPTYDSLKDAVNAGSQDQGGQASQPEYDPYAEEATAEDPEQGMNVWEQPADQARQQPENDYQPGPQGPPDGPQQMMVDLGTGDETGQLGEQAYRAAEDAGGSSNASTDQLIAAAIEGPVERVLDLIGRGVDPNARDAEGQLPLVMAVLGGDVDIVGSLAAAGADVNGTDAEGKTALHYAFDPMIVDVLLTSGANPNARDRQGVTPLMEAADAGEPDIVEMLLDYGGDPNARNNSGRTALSIARDNGWDDVERLLREGGPG